MSSQVSTPVVLIAFNRPDLTRRTMERVREARPQHLFVVADGPRPDRPRDAALCAEVRAIIDRVDWPCQVHTRISEVNIGCEANVELGLDWVFGHVERAVVLEDDCIPDPTFFRFCDELLELYAHDERVWYVAGNSHWVSPRHFDGLSYAFSTYAAVWGWATWRRAWQAHRAVFPRDHAGAESPGSTAPPWRTTPGVPAEGALVTASGARHYRAVARCTDGGRYGWDSHWWVTIAEAAGLVATPARNLVCNDGFGVGASHTRSSRSATPAQPASFPLDHPSAVAMNPDVQREMELLLLRANGRLANAVRRVVRPLWLRGVIRRVVSSPPIWRLVQASTTFRTARRRSGGKVE